MIIIPKKAYDSFDKWLEGNVFFLILLTNFNAVSGGSPSPVVEHTNTTHFSLSIENLKNNLYNREKKMIITSYYLPPLHKKWSFPLMLN